MSNKEKHTIKNLFQSIDIDAPSTNFTHKVMDKVVLIKDNILLKDLNLTSLLKKTCLAEPRSDFSTELMSKLSEYSIRNYKPIISKKAWSIIFLGFIGLIVFLLFSNATLVPKNDYIEKFSNLFLNLSTDINNVLTIQLHIPTILIVSIICFSLLMLIDNLFRANNLLKKNI